MKKYLKFIFIFLIFFIMFKVHASELNLTELDFVYERMTCEELLGPNLVKVLHLFISIVRLAGAIICIVSGMLTLVPAVVSDDASALKKAYKNLIYMLIILVVIGLFPSIIHLIGSICKFDLTCI